MGRGESQAARKSNPRRFQDVRLCASCPGRSPAARSEPPWIGVTGFDEDAIQLVCIGALGDARIQFPRDILTICVGGSTRARCGVMKFATAFEPEWSGLVTIFVSHATLLPVWVYANKGWALDCLSAFANPTWPPVQAARKVTGNRRVAVPKLYCLRMQAGRIVNGAEGKLGRVEMGFSARRLGAVLLLQMGEARCQRIAVLSRYRWALWPTSPSGLRA
jgi:hypothetical protein